MGVSFIKRLFLRAHFCFFSVATPKGGILLRRAIDAAAAVAALAFQRFLRALERELAAFRCTCMRNAIFHLERRRTPMIAASNAKEHAE